MPDRKKLEEQVEILRGQLEQDPPLSEEKREALEELIAKFEVQLELEPATQTPSISDDVNQAAIEFDAEHPVISGTLRNIMIPWAILGSDSKKPHNRGAFQFYCRARRTFWNATSSVLRYGLISNPPRRTYRAYTSISQA